MHVALGTLLEREAVLRHDGVIDEARAAQIHLTKDRIEEAAKVVRLETSIGEQGEALIETRAVERLEAEQRAYLQEHPDLLQSPADVIRMDEEGRAGLSIRRWLTALVVRLRLRVLVLIAAHRSLWPSRGTCRRVIRICRSSWPKVSRNWPVG